MTSTAESLPDDELEQSQKMRRARTPVGSLIADTYKIVGCVGSGGMSDVFAAEHVRLKKLFAVKLLRQDIGIGQRAANRFRREARAIAALKSEHVVSVVDCGQLDDGTPYLVMELLEGEDLRSLLRRTTQLPVRRTVQIVVEACQGLTVVHAAGLVHRDLKPENLFISRRAKGEDWCKVLDFGVAKMDASQSTAHGVIVGTVRYMAPEQLANSASVSPATDVYALGAILYECLAGQPLHKGESVQEVMYSVMNSEPVPLSMLRPGLPQSVSLTIAQCLSRDAASRPSTTAELAALLLEAVPLGPAWLDANSTVAELDEGSLSFARGARGSAQKTRTWKFWVPLAALLAATSAAAGWAAAVRTMAPPLVPRAGLSRTTLETPPTAVFQPAVVANRTEGTAPVASLPVLAQPPEPSKGAGAPAAVRARNSAPRAVASQAPPHRSVAAGRFDPANPYAD